MRIVSDYSGLNIKYKKQLQKINMTHSIELWAQKNHNHSTIV